MCGITGIMSPHKEEAIKKMTDVLYHRGPDDSGFWWSADCGVWFMDGKLNLLRKPQNGAYERIMMILMH